MSRRCSPTRMLPILVTRTLRKWKYSSWIRFEILLTVKRQHALRRGTWKQDTVQDSTKDWNQEKGMKMS